MFVDIVTAAEEDIKFNRDSFNKITTEEDYINVCKICHELFLRVETMEINLYLEVAKEVARLKLEENLSYDEALKKAKEKCLGELDGKRF